MAVRNVRARVDDGGVATPTPAKTPVTEYTYDPTQGKVVPVSDARVVTYVRSTPDAVSRVTGTVGAQQVSLVGAMPTRAQTEAANNAPATTYGQAVLSGRGGATTVGGGLQPTTTPGEFVSPSGQRGVPDPNAEPVTQSTVTQQTTIPSGGKAPSFDVFRNIISIAIGANSNEPWIRALYDVAKNYLDDGTISPADPMLPDILLNDKNAPKEFKDRFKGIFALRAKNARFIPSVADYIKAEKDFGIMFRNAGLRDLDNPDFFAQIVENEVDYETASNLINDVYQTINMADTALKNELRTFFPNLAPNDLAKGLLLGKEGQEELALKISQAEIKSEATVRGIQSRLSIADLARRGLTRGQAAEGFESVATELQPLSRLSQIYERQQAASPETIQTELETEAFLGQQSKRKRRLAQQEIAAFSGSAGTTPTLASRARAGQF